MILFLIQIGTFSRWEFIQGESAMQRKYVNATRSSASRSYRKKLQKRLMHRKQHLQEIEQAKKAFHAFSQVCIYTCSIYINIQSIVL